VFSESDNKKMTLDNKKIENYRYRIDDQDLFTMDQVIKNVLLLISDEVTQPIKSYVHCPQDEFDDEYVEVQWMLYPEKMATCIINAVTITTTITCFDRNRATSVIHNEWDTIKDTRKVVEYIKNNL